MYVYDAIDQQMLDERVQQYRGQTERFLKGELSEAEFLPLRLQNGLYVQRLAPMLRVCIPYGLLNSAQLRKLAYISRHYDKGFAHISTRQNIQYNWPQLEQVPDILADLASVQMHAIQTSGNCIRNVTADQYAGVAQDEFEDPRPWCEIVRQWATFHPEFAYLPRKFKIAVCGSQSDRAATYLHDIGLELTPADNGESAFRVLVGGGLGRTPVIGTVINENLPQQHLLSYLEAILRVYNQHGRRDNKYKARIKILVRALGADKFRELVNAEWAELKNGPTTLTREAIDRARASFTVPYYETMDPIAAETDLQRQALADPAFGNWLQRNVLPHRAAGYAIVNLSLKATGFAPGDISDVQMEAIADMAEDWSLGEIRTSHQQNIVLGDVRKSDLYALWQKATEFDLATANIGYLTDIICCPGGDYCALANAKSIPIAEAIQRRFDDLDFVYDLGQIDLNISGCMNACSHHHVGHIGILGVDKKGREFYQVSLGGNADKDASLGKILGPAFEPDAVPDVIANILETFLKSSPEAKHFVIISRQDPFLPISALRSENQVNELRTEDLKFTAPEVQTYLENALSREIDPKTVATWEERTEGWVTGLQLAIHSLDNPEGHGAERQAGERDVNWRTILTNREYQILLLLQERLRDKEIAGRLCISTETVKTHLKNIYGKLQAADRRDAVIKAQQLGVL